MFPTSQSFKLRIAKSAIYLIALSIMSVGPSLNAEEPIVAHAYFDQLTSLCGSRYEGEMTFPENGQDSFAGKLLVAEFSSCSDAEIRVPFRVGDDTSRTWVFSKTEQGVRLKHDHRHKDGTPDEVTEYGGDSMAGGTASKQSFPADAFTANLIPEAATNVWTVSVSDDKQTLTYHLTRHAKPRVTAVLTLQ